MTLNIHLLGPVQINRNDQPIEMRGHKPLALLAYLCVTGKAHTRRHLVDLLFDDSDDPRSSLRYTLSVLRKAIGADHLLTDRQEIAFNFESDYWLDLAYFNDGQIDLYRGDFLEGLSLRDAFGFEDWAFFERERLRGVYQDELAQQLAVAENQGNYQTVVRTAHTLLRLDNLREEWHRALMLAYARLGNRDAAVAQYGVCRQILADELGLEPTDETILLLEQIQSGSLTLLPPAAISPGVPVKPPAFLEESEAQAERTKPVFVARERELIQLNDHLTASLEGQGRVVFITGEAGLGKTTLLSEFAYRAQEIYDNLIVANGNCNAYAGIGDPYLPFRDVLGMLSGDVEARWKAGAISREHARRLWNLLPITTQALVDTGHDLIDVFIPGPPLLKRAMAGLPGGAGLLHQLQALTQQEKTTFGNLEQRQLFEQYLQVLHTLAEQQPLLLWLDDLQWADGASINLLFHLGRRLAGSRILILGSYRSKEVDLGRVATTPGQNDQHPLKPVVNELVRQYGDIRLDLEQSVSAEGRAFVDDLLDSQTNRLSEMFRQTLFERTGGHPLFTVELLRSMQNRGDLVRDEAGDWIEAETLDWAVLPSRVEAVIEQRLDHLDETLRDILTVASVEGEIFTAQIVAHAQDVNERQLLRQLSRELSRRNDLVRQQGEVIVGDKTLSRYQFTHVLFQQYLYDQLDPGERRLLHGEIAEFLAELYADHTDEVAVQLARHYVEAGENEKALKFLLIAGDQTRLAHANETAIAYYQQALIILKERGEHERAARTLMKLGLTYHNAFEFESSHRAYEEGFVLWQKTGRPKSILSSTPASPPLKIALYDITNLDPAMVDRWHLLNQFFSGLVEGSPDMEVLPDVAHRWEILDEGRKYIFHLRDDVVWSDGRPVTAADFEYAWKRVLNPATGAPSADILYGIKGARAFHEGTVSDADQIGVKALDKTTLGVELETPAGYFLHLLNHDIARPVPRHIVEVHGDAWTDVDYIVTNGPFRVESWSRGESAVAVKNPTYHGRFTGNVERVELRLTPWSPSDNLELYEADRLDIDWTFLLPQVVPSVYQQYAGEYISVPWLQVTLLNFDLNHPPFNDRRVRQAFALAIDQKELAEKVFDGRVTPATGGLIPPKLPGHSPDIALPYDPVQAQQLLAQAGYPEGVGFPNISWMVLAWESLSEYLRVQWRTNLGINLTKAELVDFSTLSDRFNQGTQPAMSVNGWIADYPDPDNFFRGAMNYYGFEWPNNTYTELLDQAGQITDQAARQDLYRQADKIVIDEAAIIPLAYGRGHMLIKPWVKRYPTSPVNWWFWKDVVIEPH